MSNRNSPSYCFDDKSDKNNKNETTAVSTFRILDISIFHNFYNAALIWKQFPNITGHVSRWPNTCK